MMSMASITVTLAQGIVRFGLQPFRQAAVQVDGGEQGSGWRVKGQRGARRCWVWVAEHRVTRRNRELMKGGLLPRLASCKRSQCGCQDFLHLWICARNDLVERTVANLSMINKDFSIEMQSGPFPALRLGPPQRERHARWPVRIFYSLVLRNIEKII